MAFFATMGDPGACAPSSPNPLDLVGSAWDLHELTVSMHPIHQRMALLLHFYLLAEDADFTVKRLKIDEESIIWRIIIQFWR